MSIIALLAVAAFQTPAQQWIFAGGDADTGFAIDTASLRRSGSTVTGWVIAIPNRPTPNRYIGVADYVLSRSRFDCEQETTQDISRYIYRPDGSLAHSTTALSDPPAVPPPGSTGQAMLALVCTPGAMDGLDVFDTPQAVRDAFRAQYGSR